MPDQAVEFLIITLAVLCLGFVLPVREQRLSWLLTADGLPDEPAVREQLRRYLLARRRMRTLGVLVAVIVTLVVTLPQHRIVLPATALLAGWLIGAALAEVVLRGPDRQVPAVGRWRQVVPWALLVLTAISLPAALAVRSEGTDREVVAAWGAGAVVAALVTAGAIRFATHHGLRGLAEPGTDAARGITAGGAVLSLACLGQMWFAALPGPDDGLEFRNLTALAVVLLVGSLLSNTGPVLSPPRRRVLAVAAGATALLVVLPLVWALPQYVRAQPPITPEDSRAVVRVRVVDRDTMAAALADLDLRGINTAGPFDGERAVIGRLDAGRAAPAGSHYEVLAIRVGSGDVVGSISGPDGSGWMGSWGVDLPRRYPWLSGVADRPVAGGVTTDAEAVSFPRNGSAPMWFTARWPREVRVGADEFVPVLLLVRDDDAYVYWAYRAPVVSS
ncbi:hypothetical protein [Hamadaea tsunoensis]|uniref:hypothetical protein n=1 Tax=Hamadaea tsunoensis TaxID=53368 RepID=UPI0003F584C8|nr:hypothetical protein [Hamadaea tsunoensis]